MGGYSYEMPFVDGQGFHRCESCWNSHHENCKKADCGCPCRDKTRKIKRIKNHPEQTKIDTDDVIEIR